MIIAVTVTYNGASVLRAFLACYAAQVGAETALIIIDNASQDGTCEILAQISDPRITVVLNDTNVGVAAANNQGIKLALARGATSVLLVNNDTEFDEALFAALETRRVSLTADAISPIIPYFNAPNKIWYGGGTFSTLRGMIGAHDHFGQPLNRAGTAPFETSYAPTCCLLLGAGVFKKIGLMDERYFVYWDDTDFAWRMKGAGLHLVCDPSLMLLHKVSVSTGGSESDFSIRYLYRNHMIFIRKFFGTPMFIWVITILTAKAVSKLIMGRTSARKLRLQWRAMREGMAVNLA